MQRGRVGPLEVVEHQDQLLLEGGGPQPVGDLGRSPGREPSRGHGGEHVRVVGQGAGQGVELLDGFGEGPQGHGLDLVASAVGDPCPSTERLGRRLRQEPGLADAGGTVDQGRAEPHVGDLVGQPAQGGELDVPPDDGRGELPAEPARQLGRGHRPDRRRRTSGRGGGAGGGGTGPGRTVQGVLLLEDGLLQPEEAGPRLDAQLLAQHGAAPLVPAQGVGLATQPVEAEEERDPHPLPEPVEGDRRLGLGHGAGRVARTEERLEALLHGRRPQGLEAGHLGGRPRRPVDVGERRTPPPGQSHRQPVRGGGRVAPDQLGRGGVHVLLELPHVDPDQRRVEGVGPVPGAHGVVAEGPTEPPDVALQRARRRRRGAPAHSCSMSSLTGTCWPTWRARRQHRVRSREPDSSMRRPPTSAVSGPRTQSPTERASSITCGPCGTLVPDPSEGAGARRSSITVIPDRSDGRRSGPSGTKGTHPEVVSTSVTCRRSSRRRVGRPEHGPSRLRRRCGRRSGRSVRMPVLAHRRVRSPAPRGDPVDLCRIRVVGETAAADVALPADLPVVDMLTDLVALVAPGVAPMGGTWRLVHPVRGTLAQEASLGAAGILDGTTLLLADARTAATPAVVVEDVAEAIGEALAAGARRLSGPAALWTGGALFAGAAAVAVAPGLPDRPVAYAVLGVGVVASLAGPVLGRVRTTRTAGAALALAAIAWWAVGTLALATEEGWRPLVVLATGAAGVGAGALLGLLTPAAGRAAAGILVAAAAVGVQLELLSRPGHARLPVAAVAVAVLLVLGSLVPVTLPGLAGYGSLRDGQTTDVAVDRWVHGGRALQAWLLVGLLVGLVPAVAVCLGEGTWEARTLVGLLAVAVAGRARRARHAWEVAPAAGAAATAALALAVVSARQVGGDLVPALAVAVALGGAGLLAAAVLTGRDDRPPRSDRLLELLEVAATAAAIPVAVAATGLFAAVTGG